MKSNVIISQHGNTVYSASVQSIKALPNYLTLEITRRELDSRDPRFKQRQFQITLPREQIGNLGRWLATKGNLP